MYSAPSVSYPVGRSRGAAWLLMLLWVAGAAACGFWAWQVPAAGWLKGLALLVVLATGGGAACAWWRMPVGLLAWDGEAWSWSSAGGRADRVGTVDVVLDLQAALLLRWQPSQAGAGGWRWLQRSGAPMRWNDMRRAVYSRAIPDALRGAEPPSATP